MTDIYWTSAERWPDEADIRLIQVLENNDQADPICDCGQPGYACNCERLAEKIGHWSDGIPWVPRIEQMIDKNKLKAKIVYKVYTAYKDYNGNAPNGGGGAFFATTEKVAQQMADLLNEADPQDVTYKGAPDFVFKGYEYSFNRAFAEGWEHSASYQVLTAWLDEKNLGVVGETLKEMIENSQAIDDKQPVKNNG